MSGIEVTSAVHSVNCSDLLYSELYQRFFVAHARPNECG